MISRAPSPEPRAPLVDSHCHLADEAFVSDLEVVIARAREAGLVHALCILAAGDADEEARAQRIAELWPAVRFAIGVHPHQAHQFAERPEEAATIARAAIRAAPLARALGEIGLDYHYDFSPREVQREVFRAQVRMARDLDLPIVIHTREAESDTLEILRAEGDRAVRGVFHCFTGDVAGALRAVDLGFHVSFAGIVTFPRAAAIRNAARSVPADHLLVETDSPYLAPVPHRGRRNEPARVRRVAEAVAETRGVGVSELERQITENFGRLFRP